MSALLKNYTIYIHMYIHLEVQFIMYTVYYRRAGGGGVQRDIKKFFEKDKDCVPRFLTKGSRVACTL